jgi:tetratricopeptide (TPR) repeat protein
MGERRHSAHHLLDLVIGLKESQRKQGRLDEAEKTSRSAIDIAVSMKNAGAHARALDALLDVFMDQGRYDEAEHTASFIERLERSRRNPDLGRIVGCTRKLACVLHQSQRKEQATAALEKANRYCQQMYGPKHIETAHSWAELGAIYREMADHASAQRCLRLALKIYKPTLGPDSPEVGEAMSELASSLAASGQIDEAVGEYERALALKNRQVGGDPRQTAELQAGLAALYLQASRAAAARELLIPAIATLEKDPDARFAFALDTMALVEELMGRTKEANSCRERARAIYAA